MSHWVDRPALRDRLTGDLLLALRDPCWSLLRAEWRDHERILLVLCRYPGDHEPPELAVLVDCARRRAWLGDHEVALTDLERRLEGALRPRSGEGR